MADNKSWFATYWKDLLKVITVVFAVFYVAVFSGVWADRNYKSNFWPDFFMWSGIGVGVLLLIGWVIMWTSQNKDK